MPADGKVRRRSDARFLNGRSLLGTSVVCSEMAQGQSQLHIVPRRGGNRLLPPLCDLCNVTRLNFDAVYHLGNVQGGPLAGL